ncbi:hypothetical protein NG800_011760 [Epilithonimonas ginsengisoli]|uniref:Uncharacterized protein n=2 Tax=Epilithonimonas TaxID=2782229 RepID=A0ABU4JIT9_9FLAO|nr:MULTISPECIES: hypothetical protein [Chryseobacterium group]MBV6880841.1 hypothetical protein [Epilithonimonas sp. FP105]MDW8549589.1 hypothetical protein [Epilithonimonas ginsengisoli]
MMNIKHNEEIQISKIDKSIILIFFIFIFGLIATLGFFGYFNNQERDTVLAEEYSGKVIELFHDHKDHSSYKAKLSNGKTIYVYFPLEKQFETLNLNDSIIKQKNSVYILVFKNGKFERTINTLTSKD